VALVLITCLLTKDCNFNWASHEGATKNESADRSSQFPRNGQPLFPHQLRSDSRCQPTATLMTRSFQRVLLYSRYCEVLTMTSNACYFALDSTRLRSHDVVRVSQIPGYCPCLVRTSRKTYENAVNKHPCTDSDFESIKRIRYCRKCYTQMSSRGVPREGLLCPAEKGILYAGRLLRAHNLLTLGYSLSDLYSSALSLASSPNGGNCFLGSSLAF
jgi:hypothetical protein